MPTSFTAALVEKNLSFPEFAMLCTRAMGATIMMRDDPFDTPIPERFEPTDWHVKEGAKAKAKLDEFLAMGMDERTSLIEQRRQSEIDRHNKTIADDYEEYRKLNETLDKVREWIPPTADHLGLKEFMADQLAMVMRDLKPDYHTTAIDATKAQSQVELLGEYESKLRWDVSYHERENREEIDRIERRNRWLKQLRENLATLQLEVAAS